MRGPHHNYNDTEKQYFWNRMNNKTLKANQNPPDFVKLNHLKWQATLVQCELIIKQSIIAC